VSSACPVPCATHFDGDAGFLLNSGSGYSNKQESRVISVSEAFWG
jgi:hypothetical protein